MLLNNDAILTQIEELAQILQPWNGELVVGGGVALILYDMVLSKANSGAVATTDIDFLIPRKPIKPGNEKISALLVNNGYEAKNKSLDTPSVQSFIKQIEEVEFEVEFLTDNRTRNPQDVVQIAEAGVNAQALSYIEMSLKEYTPLILPSGTHISIVKPEAWVFHKGLTFTKRNVKSKKYKDLYGIWFVLTQLSDVSIAVRKALPKLMKENLASWSTTFNANLKKWVTDATPEDWNILVQQDVNGVLTQASFESLISEITKA